MDTTTVSSTIDASGSGPLVLTNVQNNLVAGAKTLTLGGANTDDNIISSNLTDSTVGAGGALAITKTDGGIWVLTGDNTFSGSVAVASGELGIGSSTALGSGNTVTVTNSSLFSYGADQTIANAVTIANNGSMTLAGQYSLTVNNVISGATGTNSWIIYNELPSSKTFTFNGFANLNTATTGSNTLTVNGTGDTVIGPNGATDVIADSTHGAATNLTFSGSGSLTLGGVNPNTYSGKTTLSGTGTVYVDKLGAFGASSLVLSSGTMVALTDLSGGNAFSNATTLSGSFTVGGASNIEFSSALTLGKTSTFTNSLSSGSLILSGGITNTASSTLTLQGSGLTSITGNLTNGTGTTTLIVTAAGGTVTLGGTDTYTGATTLNAGTVILDYDASNTAKLSNAVLTLGGATLDLTRSAGSTYTESVASTTLTASTASYVNINNTGANNLNFTAGTITHNTGSFVDFNIMNSNSTDSPTTINVGSTATINNTIGWAVINNSSGALFANNSSGTLVPATTVAADDISTWTSTQNVTDSSGYTGLLSGSSLAVNSIAFNAAASSTVTIDAGSRLFVNTGGILVSAGVGANAPTITGGGITAGASNELFIDQQDTASPLTIASNVRDNGYDVSLTKAGLGTVILSSPINSYSGITSVDEGTLQLGANEALGDYSGVMIAGNASAELDLNGYSATVGTLSSSLGGQAGLGTLNIGSGTLTVTEASSTAFSGTITGTGALVQNGAGTLTLNTSSNPFSGSVTVTGGILDLGGDGVAN
ncbi:MAG TPA: autotransporter-associated beta strand repeat-containing protein, partial [Pirellulales bacterium]